jgi:cell division transport system permease protein
VTIRLRHHLQRLGGALRQLIRDPLGSALNALVIGVALALPLGAIVTLATIDRLVPSAAAEPEISVFLDLDATRADTDRIQAELARLPGVRRIRFVSKDQALVDIGKTEGLGEVVGAMKRNPLPALVARLAIGTAAEGPADSARRLGKVTRVQFDSAWVQRLQALLALGRAAAGVLCVPLGVGLVAATFNTIRLQLATRRDEIEVSRLVGATEAWIRRPFLYFGAAQGGFGAMVAITIVAVASFYLGPFLTQLTSLYGRDAQLALPSGSALISVMGLAAILDWLVAWS